MSVTVTISGSSSELESHFQPPLSLSGHYECGLLYFSVGSAPDINASNIIPVIRIECDLVHGSYLNGIPTHVIHEFVSNGFQCLEIPQNIIYYPINKNTISSISIKIVDQFGYYLNFKKDRIQLRLHLRKTK